jgi:flagellar hook capping protein FlgD
MTDRISSVRGPGAERPLHRFPRSARRALLALLPLVTLALPAPARAGVTVALQPSAASVAPGSEFDVYLQVTQAGSAFNGFDAIVGYNPAALTLIRLSDAQQEGALLTSACGNLFHRFSEGTDRDTISAVLLCNQTFVTGPGTLYRLHFKASNNPQVAVVSFLPGLHFYNAGLYVTPVTSSNATIAIGSSVGVGTEVAMPGLRVLASPNPARGAASLRIESDQAGAQAVRVLDSLGRVVRDLGRGRFAAGSREISWNRRSDAGRRLPAGVYTIEVTSGEQSARTRLILLP